MSVKNSLTILAVSLFSVLGMLVAAAPAHAVQDPAIVIESPVEGAPYAADSVTWRVRLGSDAPQGSYDVSADFGWVDSFSFDGTTTEFTGTLAEWDVVPDATNTLSVRHWETGRSSSVTFQVASAPQIYQASASPQTFYPTVRDGFRDGTLLTFAVDGSPSTARMVVRNAAGRAVRSWSWSDVGYGDSVSRTWDGKNAAGKLLPLGWYTVGFSASNEVGTDTVTRDVRIHRRRVELTRNPSKWGVQTSSRSRRGNCSTYPAGGGALALDCWGGRYAQAEHRYRIPTSVQRLRYTVYYIRQCCSPGRMQLTHRWRGNHLTVRVRATRWRRIDWVASEVRYRQTVTQRPAGPGQAAGAELPPGVVAKDFAFTRPGS